MSKIFNEQLKVFLSPLNSFVTCNWGFGLDLECEIIWNQKLQDQQAKKFNCDYKDLRTHPPSAPSKRASDFCEWKKLERLR